jgi:hypothetical protein
MEFIGRDDLNGRTFHTVSIESAVDKFIVTAKSNSHNMVEVVGSVAIGDEAVGIEQGEVRFGAADRLMKLTYTDFDEYDYDEIQVEFVGRDQSD